METGTQYLRQACFYYESDDDPENVPEYAEVTIHRDTSEVTLGGFTVTPEEVPAFIADYLSAGE